MDEQSSTWNKPDFDPVLAEVICDRWCPPGGVVLDSHLSAVRRFVFEHLRRDYRTELCGSDLFVYTGCAPEAVDGVMPIGLLGSPMVRALRDDRFAVAVATDKIDEKGTLAGIPATIAAAFREEGLRQVDELVYVPEEGRHSVVMVFVKGDLQRALAACEE